MRGGRGGTKRKTKGGGRRKRSARAGERLASNPPTVSWRKNAPGLVSACCPGRLFMVIKSNVVPPSCLSAPPPARVTFRSALRARGYLGFSLSFPRRRVLRGHGRRRRDARGGVRGSALGGRIGDVRRAQGARPSEVGRQRVHGRGRDPREALREAQAAEPAQGGPRRAGARPGAVDPPVVPPRPRRPARAPDRGPSSLGAFAPNRATRARPPSPDPPRPLPPSSPLPDPPRPLPVVAFPFSSRAPRCPARSARTSRA